MSPSMPTGHVLDRGWGDQAGRYVRLVYANEPVDRLRGVGDRVRDALVTPS